MSYIFHLRKYIGHDPIIMTAAAVLVFNQKRELLLQLRSDTQDWGLPGGAMELGESLEQTARRELYEETGLTADGVKFVHLFSGPEFHYVYPNQDQVDTVIALYEAQNTAGTLQMQDGESQALVYFPLTCLPDKLETRTKIILERLKNEGILYEIKVDTL